MRISFSAMKTYYGAKTNSEPQNRLNKEKMQYIDEAISANKTVKKKSISA